MKFGVVIPTYNRRKTITDALNSIALQTFPVHRVVVVDDGSTDDTANVIDAWRNTSPPYIFEYLTQCNQGPGSARNKGIYHLEDCEYIALLDSDDIWPSSHIEFIATYFRNHPDAVACSGQSLEIYETEAGERVSETLISLPLLPEIQGPKAILISGPSVSSTVIRRDTLLKTRLFDQKLWYGEDRLLFMEVSCLGRWGRIKTEPVLYRNKVKTILSDQLSNRPHQNSRIRYTHMLDRTLRPYITTPTPFSQGTDLALWKAWHRAAKQLSATGHHRLAAKYYARALHYKPLSKSWGRLIVECVKSYF